MARAVATGVVVLLTLGPAPSLRAQVERAAADAASKAARVEHFEKKVRPIFMEKCVRCHGAKRPKAGLRLDSGEALSKGGESGRAIVPGDPDASLLIRAVRQEGDLKMPPKSRLDEAEVKALVEWVAAGAIWPSPGADEAGLDPGAKHWAFRPIERPAVPPAGPGFSGNLVDAFIDAAHREHGLEPAPPADRRTLIRRLSLDLLGLPPSPEEVDAFLADDSPEAYVKLVDRLLASPRHGERWGRHWLDVARFAESEGYAENTDWPHMWRYRDWVVDSFNQDRPYSEFILAQLAGDEMTPYSDDNLVATGFLSSARTSGDEASNVRQLNDIYVDIVNVTSSAFLGLTLACAQCHDHRFDPLTLRDYYRLQAFFVQGMPGNVVLDDGRASPDPEALATTSRELRQLTTRVRERVLGVGYDEEPEEVRRVVRKPEDERTIADEAIYRATRARLNIRIAGCNAFRQTDEERKQLDALRKRVQELAAPVDQAWVFYSPVTSPHELSLLPMQANFPLVHDEDTLARARAYLYQRGDPYSPSEVVRPGFPEVLASGAEPDSASRTALARWLTRRDNPLTARVWVNRIWHYHFGRGIVGTPGNFGVRGARPTHPELLDWLAAELIDSGWSTKHIHRLLVTSRAYRLTAQFHAANAALDPENRFLWRWSRRRLEAEAIRDVAYAACGALDLRLGGPSVRPGKEAETGGRRSLYLFQKRDNPPSLLALFDGPTAMSQSCSARGVSTNALQSLHLLNNETFLTRARALGARIRAEAGDDPARQVEVAFRMALYREPDAVERAATLEFLRAPDPSVLDAERARITSVEVAERARLPADGDRVVRWADRRAGEGGTADDARQSAASRMPRLIDNPEDAINGRPVIRFAGGGPGSGKDQLLAAPDSDDLDATTGYTFFALVRFRGEGHGNNVVFLKARNGGNDIGAWGLLRLRASGRPAIGQNIGGAWADRLTGSQPLPDNVPVLLVGRFDGQRVELAVFGTGGPISDDTAPLEGAIDPGSAGELGIGGYVDAFSDGGERLNGDIGELIIFRAALSDARRDEVTTSLRERWLASAGEADLAEDPVRRAIGDGLSLGLWLRADAGVETAPVGVRAVLSPEASTSPALHVPSRRYRPHFTGHAPAADEASVTYGFDRPVEIGELELVVHEHGVTEVEGFVGDRPGELRSIGRARSTSASAAGAGPGRPYPRGRASHVFAFDRSALRAGRIFRFVVRETVLESGFTNYQAYPRTPDHARVPPDRGLIETERPPESNLVLLCQTLMNLNEFLTIE